MSRLSAIDNDRPNKMAYALPFTDFGTMVTYGWDSNRPVDEGWWPFVKYLVMRFIVMTHPMFARLQRLSRAWDCVGEPPSKSVRKPTTIESGLGFGWGVA